MINLKTDYVKYLKPTTKIDEKLTKDEEELKKVTEEFESILIKMMLDSADKTIDRKSSMFYGGNSEEIFRGMLNDERAKEMAKSGDFGLAKMMYEQLSKNLK